MKQKKDEAPKVPAPRNMVAYLTWTEGTGAGTHPDKKKERAKGEFKHPKKEWVCVIVCGKWQKPRQPITTLPVWKLLQGHQADGLPHGRAKAKGGPQQRPGTS